MRPARLQPGDMIRVVAPARSLSIIGSDVRSVADERFAALGVRVSFGKNVERIDEFDSSPIASRVADLHDAFADPDVKAIMTVIGGHNSNQLLPYLDWDLIASNPKIMCGYSDITALTCAIQAHTGLVTYSGPHYSTFGMRDHFEQTLRWFSAVMFSDTELDVVPARTWSDDAWHANQDLRTLRPADGPWILNPGTATGDLIGGNLCTLNLLQGTPHMPRLTGKILFIEDDYLTFPENFDRQLESLLQQPDLADIAALLIGRFQDRSGMTRDRLALIIATKPALQNVLVVANLDFGHTDPMLTLPVGGHATVTATGQAFSLSIR